MLPPPPVIAWTLAAIGAVAVSKVLAKEWRRVNSELDAQERASERASQAVARDELPTLRRDPASGVYPPPIALLRLPFDAGLFYDLSPAHRFGCDQHANHSDPPVRVVIG